MFGNLTKEQKAGIAEKLSMALASSQKVNNSPQKEPLSDNESGGGEKSVPSRHEESVKYATEILRDSVNSPVVEITNIRLFCFDDLDFSVLTRCVSLSLRKNLIHELSPLPLSVTKHLKALDFFDNKIRKLEDFFESALEKDAASENGELSKQCFPNPFSSLTKLDLSYNQIRKISGLESLSPTLKELYLVENKIKVIQGLDQLCNLELLELGGNRIGEIGNTLANLVKLKQLWLGKNKIVNIGTSLNTLCSLELLSLQANRIELITPENFVEHANPCLRELYISENGIKKIEHLPLHSLKLLDFSFNPIENLNEDVLNYENMPLLNEFWLSDGKIDRWDEVHKLAPFKKTLRTVYLERNPIEQDKRYRNKVYPEIQSLNDKLKPLIKELQELGEKKSKLVESRRQLGGQKNENELVKEELNKLEPDAVVYKLIGPALIPQDQSDAKSIVANRLEYINGEMKKTDNTITDLDKKEAELQKKAQDIYRKMQEKHAQIMQQQQQ